MAEIEIPRFSHDEMLTLLGDRKICVLFGSYISTWSPTNTISGMQLSSSLRSMIFEGKDGNLIEPSIDRSYLEELYKKLPFEVINSHCPNKKAINRIIEILYQVENPNLIHALFAELLNSKRIDSIITTNYDLCFERAIKTIGEREEQKINCITNNNDKYVAGIPTFFKLHGSANQPETMVYDLSQEGFLEGWKRPILHELIKDKNLLIIGYSGIDFDICQEVSVGKPYQVIWNFLNKEFVTPNCRILESQTNVTKMIGDMLELIPLIFQKDFEELVDKGVFSIHLPNDNLLGYDSIKTLESQYKSEDTLANFIDRFSEDELLLWQLRLLNTLCYVKPAIKLAEKLKGNKQISKSLLVEILSEYGGALSPNGKYNQAGKAHLQAYKEALVGGLDREVKIREINCASDAFRGNGKFLIAWLLHIFMSIELLLMKKKDDQLSHLISRNEILLLQIFYRYIRKLHLNPIKPVIKKVILRKINRIYIGLKQNGSYFNINQLFLWADKFEISYKELYDTLGMDTVPPELGYEQLYFPLGKMMVFRSKMINNEFLSDDTNLKQLFSYLEAAIKLGIEPEVWKFELLLRKKYPDQFTDANLIRLNQSFSECEYSGLYRVIKRWLGE